MSEPYTAEIAAGSETSTADPAGRSLPQETAFVVRRSSRLLGLGFSYRGLGRSHQGDLDSDYRPGNLLGHRGAARLAQDVSLGCLSPKRGANDVRGVGVAEVDLTVESAEHRDQRLP